MCTHTLARDGFLYRKHDVQLYAYDGRVQIRVSGIRQAILDKTHDYYHGVAIFK